MKYLKVLGLILVVLTVTAQLFCTPAIHPFQNQKTFEFEKREGCQYSIIQSKDEDPIIIEYDPAAIEDIIVEFIEMPYFIEKKNNPDSQKGQSFYTNRFDDFKNDVNHLYDKISRHHKAPLPQPEFTEGIYRVFFGINVKVPKIIMSAIHELPYVKKLHKNKQYTADLYESVPLIQADSVWYNYGTMGDSIVVGVLDTGIDYTHSHLGGAFGPGHKVFGGFDYAHMDQDPYDDNGHGTHVSGIIAGDGDSLKGVAPHALLYALKVLDRYGVGYAYTIMRGISRALDPNNDGDHSDKVDVINMSLGGYGDPDDALSTAVDNATALGVISCISAGNLYTWKSIGSPGTARTALTVGSTDKSDEMSSYSSKGPNQKIFSLKPEVVAPGEDIYSLIPDNGFMYASGTSMAAPHVAGICALLKSLHPDWSPEKLKSAIMLSAKDINAHVMAQGCGRVDALAAADIDIFAIPACASFGLDDFTQSTWNKTESIKIINDSDINQDSMILFGGIKPGISLSANPQYFSLAPNDSITTLLHLSVDNSCIAAPDSFPSVYDGIIHVDGTDTNLELPWTFAVQARVSLTCNLPDVSFIFHNENVSFNSSPAIQIDYYYYEFELPFGIYDLYADIHYGDNWYCIIRENIDISTNTDIEIHSDEAEHKLQLAAVGEQGILLSSQENHRTNLMITFPERSKLSYSGFSVYDNTWYFSELSDEYSIISSEIQFDIESENNMYIVSHDILHGITSDVYLTNEPSDLLLKYCSLKFPPAIQFPYVNIGDFIKINYQGSMWYFGGWGGNSITQTCTNSDFIWSISLYYNPSTCEYMQAGLSLVGQSDGVLFDYLNKWFTTLPIYIVNDNIASFSFIPDPSTYIPINEDTLRFGDGLLYPQIYFTKSNDNMAIYGPYYEIFYGTLDEKRSKDTFHSTFSLFDQNNVTVTSGMLDESLEKTQYLNLENNVYHFNTINSSYFVSGYNGTANADFYFDMAQEDATPPQITSYKLFDCNGCITQKLSTNEMGLLQFSLIDWKMIGPAWGYENTYKEVIVDSTHLFYKEHVNDVWQELPVTPILSDSMIGWLYEADVTNLTNYDSTAIDLKLSFIDDSGNKTIWKMEPAFAVGDFHVAIDEEEPHDETTEPIILHSNYPNPFYSSTRINFSLKRPATLATLKIYNIKGEFVTAIRKENFETWDNSIEWNGLDIFNKSVSNGIYFYTLQIDSEKLGPRKMILLK